MTAVSVIICEFCRGCGKFRYLYFTNDYGNGGHLDWSEWKLATLRDLIVNEHSHPKTLEQARH